MINELPPVAVEAFSFCKTIPFLALKSPERVIYLYLPISKLCTKLIAMKTYLLLLFLLWVGMASGQELLTNNTVKSFSSLKDCKSATDFFRKIKNSDKDRDIENIIKKNTDLDILSIKEENVKEVSLEFLSVFEFEGRKILINKPDEIAYVINAGGDKKLYFYPKGDFFLTYKNSRIENNFIDEILKKKYDDIRYDCKNGKAIHDSVLDSNLRTIKKAIIFNSSDDVTNNSAISFTNGSNDTKLSVGANFNYKNNLFFNAGINTLSTNTGFLYSNKSWKNNIGASFTVNSVIGRGTQYFNPIDCESLIKKRLAYKDSLMTEFIVLRKSFDAIQNRIDFLKGEIKTLKENDLNLTLEKHEQIKKYQKELIEKEKEIIIYKKILSNPEKFMEKEIITFDRKNDILDGSKLHWLRGTMNISNQNINLDSIKILNEKEITNFPKLSVDLSYNFNNQRGLKLLNYQVFTNITMGNLLDANVGSEKPYLVKQNNDVVILDASGTQLGKYSNLKRAFWTLQSGMQSTFFIDKNFGGTLYASHTFALQTLEGTDYRNRYSVLGGLVLRINNEEDVNRATVRILAGVENEPYKTKALDNFMVKITLGIPLNFYNKKM